MLGQTSNLAINPTLYAKLPYDPLKDLRRSCLVANAPLVIVVGVGLAVQDAGRCRDGGQGKPGELNFALAGQRHGRPPHRRGSRRPPGIKLKHIPYKGAAQALTDVISGRCSSTCRRCPRCSAHIKSGKLRPLAVTSPSASTTCRSVPTIAESGLQGLRRHHLVRHPRRRPDAEGRHRQAQRRDQQGAEGPELRKKLGRRRRRRCSAARPSSSASSFKTTSCRWGKVVKDSGAKVD